jgi:hypothetical protein
MDTEHFSETQDAGTEGAWRIPLTGEETPHLTIEGTDEALRVLGEEGATALSLRATTRRGDTLPLDLVAEVQIRKDGTLRIKLRSTGEIRREINRRIREADPRHGSFGDLGERLEALTLLKGMTGKVDQIQLVAIVPPRCDVTLGTTNGPIQVGRLNGQVQVQTTNGPLDCARIEGTLSARTINGPLRIGDITGNVSVQTTSGSVTTRSVSGNLVIQTTSGTAKGENLSGQLGFKSLSGGLVVRESHFSGFYFNNTSGSCSIEATLDPGEYEMRTVSGAITLRPQANLSAILSGRTVSGSFRCQLPHRYADEDWQSGEGDARDERDIDDDGPDIALPGLTIGKRGIDIGGMLHIDDESVEMPGMRIKLKGKRERWRGRNRWEYLLGDPAIATSGQTRLRIRTVSGALNIQAGEAAEAAPRATTSRPAPAPAPLRREWPDAELWPEEAQDLAASPPTPPTPSTPPTPPAPPTPPTPPTSPALPLMPESAPRSDVEMASPAAALSDTANAEPVTLDEPPVTEAANASGEHDAQAADTPSTAAESSTGGDNLRLNILDA